MINKFKYLIFILSFIQIVTLSAEYKNTQTMDIECDSHIKECVIKILKIPEARELVEEIQNEGPISIERNDNALSQQFGAFWDEDNRIIFVNESSHRSEGDLIGSILFELHNAAVNSKLDHYDSLAASDRISREDYVESIERIEYENSKKAAEIADKGIRSGILPRSARLPTYRNFEEHYHYQKIGGHSAWISKNYDLLQSDCR